MKSSNNIDKLFAEKLSGLENSPSADAWMALEKGLQQKNKKKPIWLPYSVAAAILIILVSGVLLLNKNTTTDPAIAAQVEGKSDTSNSSGRKPTQVQVEQKADIPQPVYNDQLQANVKESLSVAKKTDKPANRVKAPKPAQTLPAIEKQIQEPEPLPNLPDMQQTIARQQPVTTLIPAALTAEPTTIVVTVQLDEREASFTDETEIVEEEAAAPEKQGKAARLLDKLRKIKKGEFDELGINKENIVAFVKVSTSRHDKQNSDR